MMTPETYTSQPLVTPNFRVVRAYFRLPPEPGGMEMHIESLSTAQRKMGIDVINLYNIGSCHEPAVQVLKKFNLRRIRPAFLRNLVFYLGACTARHRLRGSIPTVLHVHGDWSDFLYSRILARCIGAKAVVASVHDVVRKRKSLLYRLALAHCDLVFSTGKDDQKWLQNLLGRTVYHLPSAPLDVFFRTVTRRDPPTCDVITVGNFFPKKRLDLVLDCAIRRPNLRFLIVGDGPQREAILARAKKEGLGNITIPGKWTPEKVANAMQGARVFLLPSEAEGTPTAALEAMAMGLPIVLTPSNDYTWLVEQGVNGYVTRSWAIEELISNLDKVLSDEARRVAISTNNRQRASNYKWLANAERVTLLMAQLSGLGEE